MSWQDPDDPTGRTTLSWWKDSFRYAAAELFRSVDSCVGSDVQVHNMGWTVQEVQTAQTVVSQLDEGQSWYSGFLSLQHKARDADDPDYWNDGDENDEDEDDDDEDDEPSKKKVVPPEKVVWDDVFSSLTEALKTIRSLVVDMDEWQRLGGKRRLGKHTWHCYRMFKRSSALHKAVIRILDHTGIDPYKYFATEPNVGVSRKLKHMAVRTFWLEMVAPRVLGAHTAMAVRTPPVIHEKRVAERLKVAEKVTQAPLSLVAEAMIDFLNLSDQEKQVLPYLLGSGCCDWEFGGNFTFGTTPCCHREALEQMQERVLDAEEYVLLGPRGFGWGQDAKGKQQQQAAKAEAERCVELCGRGGGGRAEGRCVGIDLDGALRGAGAGGRLRGIEAHARLAAAEWIDCQQLQVMMEYWCPPQDAARWADALELLPSMYIETRLAANRRLALAWELLLRSRGQDPATASKVQGVKVVGAKGVLRACVWVLVAAVRLRRLTAQGMASYLWDRIALAKESLAVVQDRVGVRQKEVAAAREDDDEEEVVVGTQRLRQAEAELAREEGEVQRLMDRLAHLRASHTGPPVPHPLKRCLTKAAASLLAPDKDDKTDKEHQVRGGRRRGRWQPVTGLRGQELKLVPWFWFDCSLDTTRALVQEARAGTFVVRYSKEPGVMVVNWSMGVGQQMKSARVYTVVHERVGGGGEDKRGPRAEEAPRPGSRGLALEERREASKVEGFSWQRDGSVMETYPSLATLVWASRGALQYPAYNIVPQLSKETGHL